MTIEVFDVTPRTLEGLPSGLPAEIMCNYESVYTASGIRERAMSRRHRTLSDFEHWFASFHVGSYEWIRAVDRADPSEEDRSDGPSDGGDGSSNEENYHSEGDEENYHSEGDEFPSDGEDEPMDNFQSEGEDDAIHESDARGEKRAGSALSNQAPKKKIFVGAAAQEDEPMTPPTPCYADFHDPDFSPCLGMRKSHLGKRKPI